MIDRRCLIQRSGVMAAMLGSGMAFRPLRAFAEMVTLPFENGERPLVKYPQKRAMIGLTSRPPQLETPFSVFDENVITPNDAFFVRYHLADIPLNIDPDTFSVEIKGTVDKPVKLSLGDIKKMAAVEFVAVNECSGNSRGFFEPRVGGGQLANGAMGNALWKGVPLKMVLDEAGVRRGAKQVVFGGADGPLSDRTPDFAKSLDIDHARDGEVMLAYSMNGQDLPVLNGFPLRLIVPGYYGTYWVKHLNNVTVVDSTFDGYWMKAAYRIPDNDCACVEPGTAPKATIPINRMKTSHEPFVWMRHAVTHPGERSGTLTIQDFSLDAQGNLIEPMWWREKGGARQYGPELIRTRHSHAGKKQKPSRRIKSVQQRPARS